MSPFRIIFIFCTILSVLNVNAACPTNQADLEDGGTFSGDCDLTSYGDILISGNVFWTSGTVTIVGNLVINGSGSLTINPQTTINITGDLTFNGDGNIDGTINVDGDLTVGGGGVLDGNGYITYTGTNSGPGTYNGAFASCNANDCGDVTLTVELTNFTATVSGREAKIQWATSSELNNYGFIVEKSIDGSSWDEIGFVEGFGTTSAPQEYSFVDNDFRTNSYYRLNQIDFDGQNEYLKTLFLSLKENQGNAVSIHPNPSSGRINLAGLSEGETRVKILDISGKVLYSERLGDLNSTEVAINQMLGGLDNGAFFIEFTNLGSQSVVRFIKN